MGIGSTNDLPDFGLPDGVAQGVSDEVAADLDKVLKRFATADGKVAEKLRELAAATERNKELAVQLEALLSQMMPVLTAKLAAKAVETEDDEPEVADVEES